MEKEGGSARERLKCKIGWSGSLIKKGEFEQRLKRGKKKKKLQGYLSGAVRQECTYDVQC